jgi:hypothetical protein
LVSVGNIIDTQVITNGSAVLTGASVL